MSNRYCLNCGSIVPEGTKYCPVCGEPLKDKASDKTLTFLTPSKEDEPTCEQSTIQMNTREVAEQLASEPVPTEPEQPTKAVAQPQKQQAKKAEPKEENKVKKFFSNLIFEEVEDDDEQDTAPLKKQKESKKESGGSHALSIVLIVLLAVLIGAVGFLYIEMPGVLNSGLEMIGLSLPGYTSASDAAATATIEATATPAATESAATVTATPTATAATTTYIGKLTVKREYINIRDAATTSGNALGQATQGASYDVLATATADGYTWYEIGTNQWIADDGSWVTYTAN